MAKENEFTKTLQNSVKEGVIQRKSELDTTREQILAKISEVESNVVRDPRELAKLKEELKKIDKKIAEENAKKAVEKDNIVTEDVQQDKDKQVKDEEAEKTEEIKDDKDLSEEEKQKLAEEQAQALQAYHDAMVAYYEKRIVILRDQNEKGKLVSDIGNYNEELDLEAKMYATRTAYLAFGKEDPYTEKRMELQKQEKQARDKVDDKLNSRAAEYRALEEKLKKISQKEQELLEQKSDATGKDAEAIEKDLVELKREKNGIEQQVISAKTDLGDSIGELIRRDKQREGGLEAEKYEMMTKEELDNYSYLKENIGKRNNNFKQAEKLEYKQIKKDIEEREFNIKNLREQLKNTPAEDYETRLKLLKQLDEESFELAKDRRSKKDLDMGIELPEVKAKQEASKEAKAREENDKDFDKSTETLREAADKKAKVEGEKIVENAAIENIITEENKSTNKAIAAGVAISVDGPAPGPDGVVGNYVQYKVAENVLNNEEKVAPSPIPGLENSIKSLTGPEAEQNAKDYVELDEKIKAAEEQEKVVESVEKETGNV